MTARALYATLVAVSVLWIAVSVTDPATAAGDAWAYALIAAALITAGRIAEHSEDHHDLP